MALTFDSLPALLAHGFDTVIDVRSPSEFAQDHVPGAINLPALTDAQRAEVGTLYKQVSPFDARKIGAAMVARNVADHLSGPLRDKPGSWRPLVYCWRGGQRSGSVASILSQVGWRAETISGGYQTYRRQVHALLYDSLPPLRLILLDGNTGTGKTDILHRLAAAGIQTIDLEGLARHRGSLLGAYPDGQPGQKAFESALAAAISDCDPAQPILLEAESAKIGRINIPAALWAQMIAAPRIAVSAPLPARAAFLQGAYRDILDNPDQLRDRLSPLRAIRGHAVVDRWEALLQSGDTLGLATALMTDHYDPAYTRSRREKSSQVLATFTADTLDPDARDRLAGDIATMVRSL